VLQRRKLVEAIEITRQLVKELRTAVLLDTRQVRSHVVLLLSARIKALIVFDYCLLRQDREPFAGILFNEGGELTKLDRASNSARRFYWN
jgi:hypothetical protein